MIGAPSVRDTQAAKAKRLLETEAAKEIAEVQAMASEKINQINTFVACKMGEGGGEGCSKPLPAKFKEGEHKASQQLDRASARKAALGAMKAGDSVKMKERIAKLKEKDGQARYKLEARIKDGEEIVEGLKTDVKAANKRIRSDTASIDDILAKKEAAEKVQKDLVKQAETQTEATKAELTSSRDDYTIQSSKVTGLKQSLAEMKRAKNDFERQASAADLKFKTLTNAHAKLVSESGEQGATGPVPLYAVPKYICRSETHQGDRQPENDDKLRDSGQRYPFTSIES